MAQKTSNDLMSKVLIPAKWSSENCWLWTGSVGKDSVPRYTDNTYRILPRQIMWASYNPFEKLPTTKDIVTPICGIAICLNPNHLEKLTRKEAIKKGLIRVAIVSSERYAKITHCPQGHPYDSTNTRIGFQTWGGKPQGKLYRKRICRTCTNEQRRKG